MSSRRASYQWPIIAAATILFGLSLPQPALLFEDHTPLSGGHVLAWGWWGLLTLDLAWFANPAFFLSLIAVLFKKYRTAQMMSGIALALGASSFFAEEWWFNEGSGTPIVGLGLAFYLWMLGFSIVLLGSSFARRFDLKRRTQPEDL